MRDAESWTENHIEFGCMIVMTVGFDWFILQVKTNIFFLSENVIYWHGVMFLLCQAPEDDLRILNLVLLRAIHNLYWNLHTKYFILPKMPKNTSDVRRHTQNTVIRITVMSFHELITAKFRVEKKINCSKEDDMDVISRHYKYLDEQSFHYKMKR